jgi:ketosteroid isomerase-like protein
MARIAPFICLLALLALLAGCGGGSDEEEVEQTIRDFVTAVNERDADTYCDDLITDEFRERSTFAEGDRARESCKKQLKAITGLRIRLERIGKPKVEGDRATVNVTLRRSGQRFVQRVTLEKDGGDWKIAGGAG